MSRLVALVRFALAVEWRMYVGAARLLARRADVPDSTTPVRYVGAVSVLMWAITVVSAVELVALHLIIPWHGVRVAADVVGIWGLVWCLGLTGCHYVYPHLAATEGLRLRAARRRASVVVPWSALTSAVVRERSTESSRAVQVEDGVASVVVGKRTNVDLVLAEPVVVTVDEVGGPVTHEVREVRVYVDEPRDLVRLARERAPGGASRSS